jgi:mRNA interferase RelE/StbE
VTYSLKIKDSAVKALRRVPKADRVRLIEAIDRLATEPTAGGVLKGEFRGLRRLRVGSYRIVYEVDEGQLTILVVRVGHRKDLHR